MRRFKLQFLVTLSLLLWSGSVIQAQKSLVFQNDVLNQSVEIREGDYIKLRYKGYLNKETETVNYITDISSGAVNLYTKKKEKYGDDKTILLSDITGFRKIPKIQPILVPILSAGTSIGVAYLVAENDQIDPAMGFVYTLGAGILSTYLIQRIFQSRIKLEMSDGWYIKIKT